MNNEFKNVKSKVLKVVFYNAKSRWGVLSVENTVKDNRFPAPTITLVGNFDGVFEGCHIEYSGEFFVNSTYGNQIKIDHIIIREDGQTAESTVNFLSKSKIRGISTQHAKAIWKTFKEESISIVLHSPERLAEIKGIGEATVKEVMESVEDYKRLEDLINYCLEIGIPYGTIYKLDMEFRDRALEIVKEDIYSILQLSDNFTFQQIDPIALRMGIDMYDPRRLKACLVKQLKNIVQLNSSIGCKNDDLRKSFQKVSGINELSYYTATLNTLKNNDIVTIEGSFVYYKPYLDREEYNAWMLKNLMAVPMSQVPDESIIAKAIGNFPFQLNKQQVDAVHGVLNNRVSVLTGGPGSGKSTITKAVVDALRWSSMPVVLLSPTGKATRRMEECTGVGASTIHKYLRVFNDWSTSSLPDVAHDTTYIVDECSMMDVYMLSKLLEVGEDTPIRIIFIGDKDQLPSVQAGNILGDMIDSKAIPTFILTDIVRQAKDSHIVDYCARVNNGKKIKECEFDDFIYTEYDEGMENDLLNDLFDNYEMEVKEHGLLNVQVITPYKDGELGTKALNDELQQYVNTNDAVEDWGLRVGDKVMQLVNDYNKNVFNGETGIVTALSESKALIQFDSLSSTPLEYKIEEASNLSLAYATTCHKAQGAEFPVVFVILSDAYHGMLLTRKLLYTAMSRGKKKVYVYSMKGSLDKCIENTFEQIRITKLDELLNEEHEVIEQQEDEFLPF